MRLIAIFILGLTCLWSAQVAANLTLAPTSIVFENRIRSETITLINNTNQAKTYRISFQELSMSEQGELTPIPSNESVPFSVAPLVRYSPKQVKIPAGGRQLVRVILRKPKDLPPGEYRSHMLFTSIPNVESDTDIEKQALGKNEIRPKLRMNYAISIPIIVRHGQGNADAAIVNTAWVQAKNADSILSLMINRSGLHSLSGLLSVEHVSNSGKASLAARQALTILAPTNTRKMALPLKLSAEQLREGNLVVTLRNLADNDKVLDQVTIAL